MSSDQNWEAKLVKRVKALEGRLSGVNRTLNLITAALTRVRMRGRRPLTRRERVRHGKLCRLLHQRSLLEGDLRAEKERYAALSRIQKVQLGRLQTRLRTLKTRQAVRLGGPSALDYSNTSRVVYSDSQRAQIAKYWKSIWETEGNTYRSTRQLCCGVGRYGPPRQRRGLVVGCMEAAQLEGTRPRWHPSLLVQGLPRHYR